MTTVDKIHSALVNLNISGIADLTKSAIEQGVPATDILNKGLLLGMKVIGDRFCNGEVFLPELILSGRVMKQAMAILKPTFKVREFKNRGKIAIGTVKGDIHDIGKNLVLMMLEGNGWEVVDLGVDVPAEGFCTFVKENDIDILGMSALLTTTVPGLKESIDAIKEAGLRDKAKIIVGGALVTQSIADKYGADGFASNAVEAVELANRLLEYKYI